MNRYLTDKAAKKRWWDFPVIILSGMLALIAIDLFVTHASAGESAAAALASAALVVLFAAPIAWVLYRRERQASARSFAAVLDNRTEAYVPFDRLDKLSGTRAAGAKVASLVRSGYLKDVEIDWEKKVARLSPPRQRQLDPDAVEAVCRLCGAKHWLADADGAVCAVCGGELIARK